MNQTEIFLESLERDQDNREGLENLVRLASEICGIPAALINFLDEDHQLTCFSIGWEKSKIPKEESICQFTVEEDGLLLIPDTGRDERLKRIKAVRDDPRIGFYAGVPFKGVDGYSDGTLCVIDHKPRQLTELQKRALKTLASEVESRLELILGKKRILKQNSELKKKARFLKNSADVMLLLNMDELTVKEVHSDINEKLGYTSGELAGRPFTDFCSDPELSGRIEHWLQNRDSEMFSFEIRFKRKSGEPLPMLMHASRVADDIYLTGRDISSRKEMEGKLRKERKLSDGIIENLPGIFVLMDQEGTIRNWNKNLEHITEYGSDEIRGASIEKFLTYDSVQVAYEKLKDIFEHRWARSEVTIISRDGNKSRFLVSGFRFQREGERFAVVIGVDMTDKMRVLDELQEKEEKLRHALKRLESAQHIARLGSWEWDIVNNDLYWSDETFEILQVDKTYKPSLKLMLEIIHPEDRSKFTAIIDDILNGRPVKDWEHDLLLPDGNVKHLYGRGEVIYGVEGNPEKVVGTIQDITEQKRAEKRIQQTLDEKRTMLAEIHHRVKNNLAIVSGLLELEYDNVEDKRAYYTLLKSVTRIKSMAMIHEKLYSSEDFSNVSFSDYVTDLVDSIQNLHQSESKKIEVRTDVDPLSLNINQAIPCALILNELITNAFKHAFKGRQLGLIEVELNGEREQILMRVQDNGIGMPESVGEENGPSLGLTLLDVLTKQLKGEYRIDSAEGTTIEVSFSQEQQKRGSSGNRLYQPG